jgi:hypothetical protein
LVNRVSQLHQALDGIDRGWRGAAVLRRGTCAVHAALGAASSTIRPLVITVRHWRGCRLALAAALHWLRGLLLPLLLLASLLLALLGLARMLRRRLAPLLLALPCLLGLLLLLLLLLLVEQVRARPQQLQDGLSTGRISHRRVAARWGADDGGRGRHCGIACAVLLPLILLRATAR